VDLPGASNIAAIMGSEEFFEPLILTDPSSRTGPSMRNISIKSIFLEKQLLM
jgi:hypothetical protein